MIFYKVPASKLEDLIEASLMYSELLSLGVDNWEGYDEIDFGLIVRRAEKEFDKYDVIEDNI